MDKKKQIEKAANEYVESLGIKIDIKEYSEYALTDFKAGVEWALSQPKEVEPKKEQIEKAIEILIAHNKWRLGADTPHTEPKDLTFAIDTVIDALSQPKEVDLQKPVESDAFCTCFDHHSSFMEKCKACGKKVHVHIPQNTKAINEIDYDITKEE